MRARASDLFANRCTRCCLFHLRNSVQYGPLGRVFASYGYVSLKLCRRLVYALVYNVAVTVSEHVLVFLSQNFCYSVDQPIVSVAYIIHSKFLFRIACLIFSVYYIIILCNII